MMDVTVITAARPDRKDFLNEAIESVGAQNHPVKYHLIGIDHQRQGPVAIRNQLLRGVETEWVAILDDDDVLLPNHFEEMAKVEDTSDFIYTYSKVTGRDAVFNSQFDPERLRWGNYIPITVAIRMSKLNEVGGQFPDARLEDWALWVKLLDAGARFTCVPVVTWVYRFHGDNRTFTE
jgi:hypothetical protein